jgi:hypothetical protein
MNGSEFWSLFIVYITGRIPVWLKKGTLDSRLYALVLFGYEQQRY